MVTIMVRCFDLLIHLLSFCTNVGFGQTALTLFLGSKPPSVKLALLIVFVGLVWHRPEGEVGFAMPPSVKRQSPTGSIASMCHASALLTRPLTNDPDTLKIGRG